jgi:uncharacterized protein YbaA (DUF1428 family)
MSAKYIDGFLLVVPEDKVEEYKKMAELGKQIWMKHGALDYVESRGDDLNPEGQAGMEPRSFIDAAGAKKGETVWFSYIVFKSRAHRDEVNKKVMADPAMNDPEVNNQEMPFDMKRFSYGGFIVEVSA